MKPLIVVPTYNERENLENFIPAVLSIVPHASLLVVDDGSPDGTADFVEKNLMPHFGGRLFILKRAGKLGLGSAYRDGFRWGIKNGFDYLVEMDADWSHPPRFLPRMIELGSHFDFVVGSRYVRGGGTVNWGLGRLLLSRFGSIYSRAILGVSIRDFTGGFNGWNKKVIEAIDLDSVESDGYSFQIELKYRAAQNKFSWTEFPITFEERRAGASKMSSKIVREAMWRVWLLKFKNRSTPQQISKQK